MKSSLYRSVFYAMLLGAILAAGCSRNPDAQQAEQEAREKEFEQAMSGVTLEGTFSVSGSEDTRLRPERYAIESVSKVAGDYWVIEARIQYGGKDVTVPVPVKIHWAGDTPVVSLTDVEIPGLGTFTARVLFYRDHYAGFWSHGDVSGNQFGRLVRAP